MCGVGGLQTSLVTGQMSPSTWAFGRWTGKPGTQARELKGKSPGKGKWLRLGGAGVAVLSMGRWLDRDLPHPHTLGPGTDGALMLADSTLIWGQPNDIHAYASLGPYPKASGQVQNTPLHLPPKHCTNPAGRGLLLVYK